MSRLPLAAPGERVVAAPAGNLGELHEHVIEEETQPNALAFTLCAHQVHAVVPVARADERKIVLPHAETLQNGSDTMIVQTGSLFRQAGQVVVGIFLRVDRAAGDEGDGLVQHARVPRAQNVASCRERKPKIIVRTVGTHASARGRMPPVLDVSFRELAGGAADQVLAQEARLGVDQRHRVLQLVAETESTSWLVVSGPRPKTARHGLVQEPAIGQHVQGRVRGLYADRTERLVPELPHRLERAPRRVGSPEAKGQVAGVIGAPPRPQPEDQLSFLAGGQVQWNPDRGTGIQSGPDLAGKPYSGHGGRVLPRAVASKELGTVAGERPGRAVHVEKSYPAGELRVVGIPREQSSGHGVDGGDDVHG